MPDTILHWTILAVGVSLFQFVLKYIFTWLATLSFPGAHKTGVALTTIIP